MQEELFSAINSLLEHIKEVEKDIIGMTKESYMTVSKIFAEHEKDLPDEALEALQLQDIISQQLNATVEAIESVQQNISFFIHSNKEDSEMVQENLGKLGNKLERALGKAREKRSAFSGKIGHNDQDNIEFF